MGVFLLPRIPLRYALPGGLLLVFLVGLQGAAGGSVHCPPQKPSSGGRRPDEGPLEPFLHKRKKRPLGRGKLIFGR